MSVWLAYGRDIGASLLLTCLNILVAAMLMSLGLSLALAVSIQARWSRCEAEPTRSRAVLIKLPN